MTDGHGHNSSASSQAVVISEKAMFKGNLWRTICWLTLLLLTVVSFTGLAVWHGASIYFERVNKDNEQDKVIERKLDKAEYEKNKEIEAYQKTIDSLKSVKN